MPNSNHPEPPPTKTDSTPVWDLVVADMRDRDKMGRDKYGTPLQHDNGRDHLVDAYQEALDLVVYLRAEIEQRAKLNVNADLLALCEDAIEDMPDHLRAKHRFTTRLAAIKARIGGGK